MSREVRFGVVAVLAAMLVACGSAAQPAQEVLAGDSQNGQTITAHVGDTVRVSLGSTYWTFAGSSDSAVLEAQGDPVVSPATIGSCLPGMGCGITSASFKAMKAGSATVTAARVSCGEAMRCVGSAGLYTVTIAVS